MADILDKPRREAELVGVKEAGRLILPARPIVTPDDVGFIQHVAQRIAKIKTRGNFARDFLPQIGAKVTTHNLVAMMAWMQAEGDAGKFNPLNSTKDMPNDTIFNWVGVRNYHTYEDGVRATAMTLNFGASHDEFGYKAIRDALRQNKKASYALAAVEESAWGTGGLATVVYESTGWENLLKNSYLHHRLAQ